MEGEPRRLDYATPSPRARHVLWWLAIGTAAVGLLLGFGAAFLSGRRVAVLLTRTPATPAPVQIAPPTVPSRVTIVQRRQQALPGTNGSIVARVGDITGGQVLLTIDDANGQSLVPTVSAREGDKQTLAVGSATFEIELVELKNFLTSDDFAVFDIRQVSTALSEEQKIQRLIDAVATAQGLTFIRNGQPHSSADAAAHLRRKYDAAGAKEMTARQFIEHIGTRSSLSGQPYRVRLRDGSEQTAEQWLSAKLVEIERDSVSPKASR